VKEENKEEATARHVPYLSGAKLVPHVKKTENWDVKRTDTLGLKST